MAKKKTGVKKKVSVSKTTSKIVSKPVKKKVSYSWIWYTLGVLILLGVLYLLFNGMTGNAVTGNAVDTKNALKPMVDMVSGLISNIYEVSKPALQAIVGETSGVNGQTESTIFFAKVLLLLLLFSIVSSILLTSGINFLKDGWTHWVVSGVVAILSVRFLSADLVNTILIPYSTFGVVISAALPFVLYFFFVEKSLGNPKSSIIRRTAWIFFAVVFFSIWIMRQDEFSQDAGIIVSIYPMTALLAIIMAVLDGTIQKFFNKAKVGRLKSKVRASNLTVYMDKINDCNDKWKDAIRRGDPDSYISRIIGSDKGQTAYHNDIKQLQKSIDSLK